MEGLDFIAIDFETANNKRASVCEAGICIVRNGKIAGTQSWLIRPEGNDYSYWNIRIHGIRPADTAHAPAFPEIWTKIAQHLKDCPALVAHNAAFDMSCIRHSLQLYGIPVPEINYYCSLRAARRLYDFECNRLDYLCQQFDIPYGHHHRAGDDAEMCARLFLREIKDAGWCSLEEMAFCGGKL